MKRRIGIISTLFSGLLLAASALAGEPVDINSASAEDLARSLDGVGMSKARAIVEYRDSQGPFRHADELVKVKGIGISTVDKNRDNIRLGAPGEKPRKS